MLEPLRGVEQQHHHFGEIDRAMGIGDRHFLQLVLHLGALAHACGVDQVDVALFAGLGVGPLIVDRDRIAGDPGLGPGQQAVLAQQPVDQSGFARIGSSDDGQLERAQRGLFLIVDIFDPIGSSVGLLADDRP